LPFFPKILNQNILTIKLCHILTRLKHLSKIKIMNFNLTYFYWKINVELIGRFLLAKFMMYIVALDSLFDSYIFISFLA